MRAKFARASMKMMNLREYREDTAAFFASTPFFEVEIARRIDVLGNIAHVWSAYEARSAPGDAVPERRGVNSIQLYKDEQGHWRIIAMIWDNERPGVAIAPF